MAEQEQVQEQVQVSAEQTTLETVTSPDVDKYKAEINGLNRRNTELEKLIKDMQAENEEAKKASMEAEERRLYELEQRENEVAAQMQKMARDTNRAKAQAVISEFNLPVDLLDAMTFDNWDVVESSLNKFKAAFSADREKTIAEFKTSNGFTPSPDGGTVPQKITREMMKTMTPQEIAKAVDEGRVAGIGSPK